MSQLDQIKNKILPIEKAVEVVKNWKTKGNKIAFTNGCFDILHKGHVTYLAKTSDLADKLVVAINSDDSVRRMEKGTNRPINDEEARQMLIAALGFVDMVVCFNEDTPLAVIEKMKPDVLVKGADYDPEERNPQSKKYIVGSDMIIANGGKVTTIDLEKGFSTTSIIEKISPV